jgi:hypothetical protein
MAIETIVPMDFLDRGKRSIRSQALRCPQG